MYEHKRIKGILTDCLDEMYGLGYRLAYYDKEVQISVWDREIKKTRTVKNKEPQKPVTTYFSELVVKGQCGYYKDLEEQYFEWVKVRADCGKFKPFNESSEKSAWKKLGKHPKPVAERMLEVASAQSYGMLYDLSEGDTSKIMEPLRLTKQKEERKLEGFTTDEEKKQAEDLKSRIDEYVETHPQLRTEAKEYVFNLGLKMNDQATEKMIHTRCAMLAKKLL